MPNLISQQAVIGKRLWKYSIALPLSAYNCLHEWSMLFITEFAYVSTLMRKGKLWVPNFGNRAAQLPFGLIWIPQDHTTFKWLILIQETDLKWAGMADTQLISVEMWMKSWGGKLAKGFTNNNGITKIYDHF